VYQYKSCLFDGVCCGERCRCTLRQNRCTPADAAEISKVLANAAKAFEIAEIAEHARLDRMTDAELLRVIAKTTARIRQAGQGTGLK
jgi:hypothetical protein